MHGSRTLHVNRAPPRSRFRAERTPRVSNRLVAFFSPSSSSYRHTHTHIHTRRRRSTPPGYIILFPFFFLKEKENFLFFFLFYRGEIKNEKEKSTTTFQVPTKSPQKAWGCELSQWEWRAGSAATPCRVAQTTESVGRPRAGWRGDGGPCPFVGWVSPVTAAPFFTSNYGPLSAVDVYVRLCAPWVNQQVLDAGVRVVIARRTVPRTSSIFYFLFWFFPFQRGERKGTSSLSTH